LAAVNADCLFCRITARELPSDVVHETDTTLAFRDIDPRAPSHVLVIPKTHLANVAELAEADPSLVRDVLATAAAVAKSEGLAEDGWRFIFNTGRHAGQVVFHVHGHVLGGRPLGPMLVRQPA
jgi:histidine triad (HIT) family protein